MNHGLFDVQSSLFEGLPTGDQGDQAQGLVFEEQPGGALRALVHKAEEPLGSNGRATDANSTKFEEAARGGTPKAEATEAKETAVATEPGFTAMWLAYRSEVMESASRIRNVRRRCFGALNVGPGLGAELSDHYMLRETQSRIVSSIYTLAESTFAPEGGTLKIERLSMDLGEDADFNPDQLWTQLEQQYGGEAGVELAHKQLAKVLVDKFCLTRRDPVRRQNYLLIEQSTHAEKKFSGGWEYSYHSVEWIRQGMNALLEFCAWAGDHATSSKLGEGVRNFRSFEKLESRKRSDYGAVHTVSFKERMVYELHGSLGDKFHEFIAIYGAEALEEKH